jgi:hypothetical protein
LSTFELTIQNTTIPQVRNLFSAIAVFISFPLARCCAPHPTPPAFEHGCVGVGVLGKGTLIRSPKGRGLGNRSACGWPVFELPLFLGALPPRRPLPPSRRSASVSTKRATWGRLGLAGPVHLLAKLASPLSRNVAACWRAPAGREKSTASRRGLSDLRKRSEESMYKCCGAHVTSV